MRIPSKRFWIQECLFAVLYFAIAITIDYAVGDIDQSSTNYFLKEAVIAILFSFITGLLLAPENPFKRKAPPGSNLL